MLQKFKLKNDKVYSPAQLICISFASVIAVGTFFLTLPISSANGEFTSFYDALFTATSATCVTGLVVRDTATEWSTFGQGIILLLIQIGGLGFITMATFFNVMIGKKLGLRSMQLAQESVSGSNFVDTKQLIKVVVLVSLVIELIGSVILSTVFVPMYGTKGIFISVFTAVSAFCNAGFDLFGFIAPYTSLVPFQENGVVLSVVMSLIVIGGLGFVVWVDIFNYIKTRKLTLHSQIVLLMTAVLIVGGTVLFLALEYNNTLAGMDFSTKVNNALFSSITTRTAGFNTVDFAQMSGTTKLISCIMMFIGAAPGSTGGGIKVSTATVVIMTVVSVIMGRDQTVIMGRKVSHQVVYKSLAVIVVAIIAVSITSSVVITMVGASGVEITGIDAVFESVSAFATVGLSVGVTSVLDPISKVIMIFTMYLGRVGPVSFALSLAMRPDKNRNTIMPEGKILVG